MPVVGSRWSVFPCFSGCFSRARIGSSSAGRFPGNLQLIETHEPRSPGVNFINTAGNESLRTALFFLNDGRKFPPSRTAGAIRTAAVKPMLVTKSSRHYNDAEVRNQRVAISSQTFLDCHWLRTTLVPYLGSMFTVLTHYCISLPKVCSWTLHPLFECICLEKGLSHV